MCSMCATLIFFFWLREQQFSDKSADDSRKGKRASVEYGLTKTHEVTVCMCVCAAFPRT